MFKSLSAVALYGWVKNLFKTFLVFRCNIALGPGQQIIWRKGYEVLHYVNNVTFDLNAMTNINIEGESWYSLWSVKTSSTAWGSKLVPHLFMFILCLFCCNIVVKDNNRDVHIAGVVSWCHTAQAGHQVLSVRWQDQQDRGRAEYTETGSPWCWGVCVSGADRCRAPGDQTCAQYTRSVTYRVSQ